MLAQNNPEPTSETYPESFVLNQANIVTPGGFDDHWWALERFLFANNFQNDWKLFLNLISKSNRVTLIAPRGDHLTKFTQRTSPVLVIQAFVSFNKVVIMQQLKLQLFGNQLSIELVRSKESD